MSFVPPPPERGKVQVNVRLPKALVARIDRQCEDMFHCRLSRAQWMEMAVHEMLAVHRED